MFHDTFVCFCVADVSQGDSWARCVRSSNFENVFPNCLLACQKDIFLLTSSGSTSILIMGKVADLSEEPDAFIFFHKMDLRFSLVKICGFNW